MLRQTTNRAQDFSDTARTFLGALEYLCSCTKVDYRPYSTIPLSGPTSRNGSGTTAIPRRSPSRQNRHNITSPLEDIGIRSRYCKDQYRYLSSPVAKSINNREYEFSADTDAKSIYQNNNSSPYSNSKLRTKTPLTRRVWPQRLRQFLGSLPVRNYANDYVLWDMTADDVWARYQLLSEPRCLAVSRTALSFILSSLATEKPRTRKGLLRYSQILNEMTTQLPTIEPTRAEWTALISFTGRLHKFPSSNDVDNCLQIWDDMENVYNIRADLVTFNVLLDVSIKARRWQTVDSLLREMKRRAINFDRYTWTTLLFGAGLRKDGNEVRRLSRRMIESGEIMDILVINAVMSALFRCGESAEAEHLFDHIIRMITKARETSSLGQFFDAKERLNDHNLTTHFQQRARTNHASLKEGNILTHEDITPQSSFDRPYCLAPDAATFNMVLNHHCTKTGDFDRVSKLLEFMENFEIPDSIAMFRSLFFGFHKFGRTNKEWSLERLRYIFQTLLQASDIRITQELAATAIRAFSTLSSRADVEDSWRSLDQAWQEQGGTPSRRSSNVLQAAQSALDSLETTEARQEAMAAREKVASDENRMAGHAVGIQDRRR